MVKVDALSVRNLDAAATRVVETHLAAPAAAVAASLGAIEGRGVSGRLWSLSDAPHARTDTPFDLASLTKVFVALTAARLVSRGLLRLDEPLRDLCPWALGSRSAEVPLGLFASHRAGLEAHIELFAPLREGRTVDLLGAARTAADSRRTDCGGAAPGEGFPAVYSDMGYLLFGLALEARSGLDLDELVSAETLRPLGVEGRIGSARQLRALQAGFPDRVAPTEEVVFRGGVVRGVVHDENAFALRGDALAGHAGLFGDAEGVLTLGQAVLSALEGASDWLTRDAAHELVRPRASGTLRMGFDGRSDTAPSSGARLGPRTFGHLGFTGTSLWIDPDARFVGALLTNRVHPTRANLAIRAARPAAYDAMFDALNNDG